MFWTKLSTIILMHKSLLSGPSHRSRFIKTDITTRCTHPWPRSTCPPATWSYSLWNSEITPIWFLCSKQCTSSYRRFDSFVLNNVHLVIDVLGQLVLLNHVEVYLEIWKCCHWICLLHWGVGMLPTINYSLLSECQKFPPVILK